MIEIGGVKRIDTREQLDALPDSTLIWYWVEWDSIQIHAIMHKMSGEWYSATDPDDDSIYRPSLPAYVLPEEGS
jgi:hypothetical protein